MATHHDLPGATAATDATPPDTPSPATPWTGTASDAEEPRETAPGDLLNRVVQGAHETIDRLAETAAPHLDRLQRNVDGAGVRLHERADEWTDGLRTTVRANPVMAVATALALGMLIARLAR